MLLKFEKWRWREEKSKVSCEMICKDPLAIHGYICDTSIPQTFKVNFIPDPILLKLRYCVIDWLCDIKYNVNKQSSKIFEVAIG